MTSLGVALGWKFNQEPGITTRGGELVNWPATLGARPDAAALSIIVTEYEDHLANAAYIEKRAAEYPPLGDMIDAISKVLDGDPTDFNVLQMKRNAIKTKYPKP